MSPYRPTIDEGFSILDIIDQAKMLESQGRVEAADDELVMTEASWKLLTSVLITSDDEVPYTTDARLFGLPVVLEPMLPDGVVHRRPRTKEER